VTMKAHGQGTSLAIPDCGVAAGQIPVITSDHKLLLTVGADATIGVEGVLGTRAGTAPVAGMAQGIAFQMDNTAGTATWTNGTGRSVRILSSQIVKTTASGTTGDTVRLYNGANPITDARSLDGLTSGTVAQFATIDNSYNVVANGGTLVCTTVKGGTHCECEISVVGLVL
jgi:hypothetical protein